MDDKNSIIKLVQEYQKAIHTQNEKDFRKLWTGKDNTLISITHLFNGIDSIYNDFLINIIQKSYSKIDLITKRIDVHFIDDKNAVVIFQYRTECLRNNTNEPYGIQGLETQIIRKVDNEWKLVHIHYSK